MKSTVSVVAGQPTIKPGPALPPSADRRRGAAANAGRPDPTGRHSTATRRNGPRRRAALAALAVGLALPCHAASVQDSLGFVLASPDYVEITARDGVAIELRYAGANNFVGRDLYGGFNRAFLHKLAAAKLARAVRNLETARPGYRLVIFDALRPRSVQYVLWDQVKGTARQRYVANPQGGSVHNYGLALDLSILDETGRELDMGTPYDDFTPPAEPRRESQFLKEGRLTQRQIDNRRLLRQIMEAAGFIQLPVEWWHYDALPRTELKAKYKIVE